MNFSRIKLSLILLMMNDILESYDIITSNIVTMKPKFHLYNLTLLSIIIQNVHFRPKADVEDWIIKYSTHDFHVYYKMTQETFYNLLDFLQQASPEFCQENIVGEMLQFQLKKNVYYSVVLWKEWKGRVNAGNK